MSNGPQCLPDTIWLPARTTISGTDLCNATGWSRAVLQRYRQKYGFPGFERHGGRWLVRTVDVATWIIAYGSEVRWV